MKSQNSNDTVWPIKDILLFGYFGSNSPGSSKLVTNLTLSLVLFLIGISSIQASNLLIVTIPSTALIIFSVCLSIWGQKQYISKLDTLNRDIQLSGFAFSYGIVILICMVLMAIEFITGSMPSILWILIAEPIRGIVLYKIARGYQ